MTTPHYSAVAAHWEQIAAGLARLAATAASNDEANHWWAESDRFAGLAELARHDPASARRQYRPTRTYELEGP